MTGHIACIGCRWVTLTWAGQRRQFARALSAGLTQEQTKELMPRCQKCTTKALHERGLKSKAPMRRLR
jgi:hypothetical protein